MSDLSGLDGSIDEIVRSPFNLKLERKSREDLSKQNHKEEIMKRTF
jgi:hypothetical protein